MAKAKKRGQPSTFTQALASEICERLSKGEPLAQICRDAHMPTDRTVRNWREADETFASAIACARETGFDVIAVDALSILDEEPERVVTITGEDRSESRIDSASVQRAKNRFEGRLKLLAKWDPKRYGDRTTLAGDEDSPLRVITKVEREIVRPPHSDR